MIPRECLESQDLTVTRACILVNDALVSYLHDYEVIPAGYFLTYYSESFYDEEGEYVERKAIANMLEVAREKGYGLRGDYIGIGNIDEPWPCRNGAVTAALSDSRFGDWLNFGSGKGARLPRAARCFFPS